MEAESSSNGQNAYFLMQSSSWVHLDNRSNHNILTIDLITSKFKDFLTFFWAFNPVASKGQREGVNLGLVSDHCGSLCCVPVHMGPEIGLH